MEQITAQAPAATPPAAAPIAPATPVAPATPAPEVTDGGIKLENVTPAPVTNPETVVSPEVLEYQKKVAELDSKTRQFQADRDRAEAYTKNLIKQVLPLVSLDEFGNIVGLRNQTPQMNPQEALQDIYNRAALGDQEALAQMAYITKEQAKSELKQEMHQERALGETEDQIKKDFPSTVTPDGNWDAANPIIIEAQKIVQQEYPGRFNVKDPVQLRAIMEIAEARIIKRSFPDIEQRIKNEVLQKTQASGAAITGVPGSGIAPTDDLSSLTGEQVARLQKEGFDQSNVARIAKIVKQAQKEGGFYL